MSTTEYTSLYIALLHFLLDQKVHKKSRQNDASTRSAGKQEILQKLASLFCVFPVLARIHPTAWPAVLPGRPTKVISAISEDENSLYRLFYFDIIKNHAHNFDKY
jgi:hypothetical protein